MWQPVPGFCDNGWFWLNLLSHICAKYQSQTLRFPKEETIGEWNHQVGILTVIAITEKNQNENVLTLLALPNSQQENFEAAFTKEWVNLVSL